LDGARVATLCVLFADYTAIAASNAFERAAVQIARANASDCAAAKASGSGSGIRTDASPGSTRPSFIFNPPNRQRGRETQSCLRQSRRDYPSQSKLLLGRVLDEPLLLALSVR
jgi:hypothetical protein